MDNPRQSFIETAREILERIELPRVAGWWLDVEQLLQDLEQIRRTMTLPHWLPERSEELSRMAAQGMTPTVEEDRKWKPGDYSPNFFTVITLWPFENGSNVPKWLDVCIGDPLQPSFIVERREIFLDRDEVEDGKPAESGLLFDDVRKDLQFFLQSWIRYVETRPEPEARSIVSRRRPATPDGPQELPVTVISEADRKLIQEKLAAGDLELPSPKNARQAEFILWHKGQRPEFQPTRAEIMLSALLHAKAENVDSPQHIEEPKKKPRGRPKKIDIPEQLAERICQLWATGTFAEYADLDRHLNLKPLITHTIIDRKRKGKKPKRKGKKPDGKPPEK